MKIVKYGMVEILSSWRDGEGKLVIDAVAEGSYSNEYEVQIQCDANDDIEGYYCDCPAYSSYPGMCKHCAAVALQFLEKHPHVAEEKNLFRLGVQGTRTDQRLLS